MPLEDDLLSALHEDAASEDLSSIAYYLGELAAKESHDLLGQFADRARQMRTSPDVWSAGFGTALACLLEGYRAASEPGLRLAALAREAGDQPVWRELLRALGKEARTEMDLASHLFPDASGVEVSAALGDLRVRELVEHYPGGFEPGSAPPVVHALTCLGRKLLAAL
jgi:hypothetical protein